VGDLDDTKEWRLQWWGDIFDYTFNGPYFWKGKGFGINLAEDDGYINDAESPPLRSPHNSHLTFLARAGVPGFALWILVQLSWAGGIFAAYLRSRMRQERDWEGLFLFLLAYWVAFMINASFDVVLEGPYGGIWFWTLYGVGLAALWLNRHCPAALQWQEMSNSVGPQFANEAPRT
jgi:O-antigen ligase